MYYMMTCQSPKKGYLATLNYDSSEDPDMLRSWMSGDKFMVLPPQPIRLTLEPEPNTVLAELAQSPVTLMSARLYRALISAGVTNIDTYPAEIHDSEKNIVHNDYLAFNIIGRVSAAAVTRHEDVLISAPKISEKKVGNLLLFRLDEAVNTIVVHESVKAAIEAAGIDTLTFTEPSDWTA